MKYKIKKWFCPKCKTKNKYWLTDIAPYHTSRKCIDCDIVRYSKKYDREIILNKMARKIKKGE